jgi:hypothetical protein
VQVFACKLSRCVERVSERAALDLAPKRNGRDFPISNIPELGANTKNALRVARDDGSLSPGARIENLHDALPSDRWLL